MATRGPTTDQLQLVVVDARTGLVRRLLRPGVPPHLPQCLRVVCAELADSTRFGPWTTDVAVVGLALWDDAAATHAALAAAVESYAGNFVTARLRRSTYAELTAGGERVLDPTTLSLYSDAQYAAPGFPFVPFDPDLSLRWARGRTMTGHEAVWVPASLAWTARPDETGEPEAATHATLHTAIASGPTRQAAERAALFSLIEADARELTWHSGAVGRRLDVGGHLAALGRGPTGRLRTTFVEFASEFGPPSVGVLVRDRSLGYLTLGTSWRPATVRGTALHEAFAQALHGQMIAADLDDPDSGFEALRVDPSSPLKPWRDDRRYLSSYRPDWRDAGDPACHLQAYLDPALADRLESDVGQWPLAAPTSPTQSPGPAADELLSRLAAAGITPVSVDLTPSGFARTGLVVVRVIAPALYSSGPAAYPFLGGARLDAARAAAPGPPRDYPLPC
ncbi:MAG: YcaO-like family protein [Acidimicrobiales bacterium]